MLVGSGCFSVWGDSMRFFSLFFFLLFVFWRVGAVHNSREMFTECILDNLVSNESGSIFQHVQVWRRKCQKRFSKCDGHKMKWAKHRSMYRSEKNSVLNQFFNHFFDRRWNYLLSKPNLLVFLPSEQTIGVITLVFYSPKLQMTKHISPHYDILCVCHIYCSSVGYISITLLWTFFCSCIYLIRVQDFIIPL